MTLIEVIAVMSLLAILISTAIPFFSWARDKAQDDNATNRAILLNSAKSQYLLEYGQVAHAAFNARTNANKYLALEQYMGYVSSSLASYVPSGYTYTLKNLNQKTAVTASARGISLSY
jgi:hypothetical protein